VIYVATGEMLDGKLRLDARELMLESLREWSDGPVRVTIEKVTATRSQQANAYYWGAVIKAIATHNGSTPDEIHDVLKMMFLSKEIAFAKGNGEVVAEFVIGGSTRELTSSEFYDYVERIRAWAMENLELTIAPPDPNWRDEVEGVANGIR
jgi:hypothetical protein